MYYTENDILAAASLGEVSMIDAQHIVLLLPEVVQLNDYYEPFRRLIENVSQHFDTTPERVLGKHNSERERFVRMTVARVFADMGLTVYQTAYLLCKQYGSVQTYLRNFENEKIMNKYYRSYWYSLKK